MSIYLDNPSAVYPAKATNSEEMIHVAKQVISTWSGIPEQSITVTQLTGGVTNMLYVLHSPGAYPTKVVVRLFGLGTEQFVDREVENLVFSSLSRIKKAPTFFGLFQNGRVEGFLDARPLMPDEMYTDELSPKISRCVAEMHNLTDIEINKIEVLWEKFNIFFRLAENVSFPEDQVKEKLKLSLSLGDIRAEIERLKLDLDEMQRLFHEQSKKLLFTKDSDTADLMLYYRALGAQLAFQNCFSHNDLLSGNILLHNDGSMNMTIIDYEYAVSDHVYKNTALPINAYPCIF